MSDGPGRAPDEEPSLRSVGDLLSDISTDLSTLVRQEIALAKAEAKEGAVDVGKGAGMLGGAALAGQLVLVFLSVALWWSLGEATGRGWSALIVALVWAVIAAVLALAGRSQLRRARNPMERTSSTAKEIPEALKGHEHP
jgi:hypothetical protein